MKKRLLACLLTAAMLVSLLPLHALAAEAEQPEWTATASDPLDGDTAAILPPGESEQEGEPLPSDEAEEPEQTALQRVQAMIDALPAPEDITAGNRDEVEAQLEAIGEAWAELSDEDALQLNTARLEAARDALAALDGQAENELPAPLADTVGSVEYWDENGSSRTQNDVNVVDSTTTAWNSGWYVVNSGDPNNPIRIDSRVTVTGDVYLILMDDKTLTVNSGINVAEDNSLTIYGQSGGTGTLIATVSSYDAAIGGDRNEKVGSIVINGGTINATGGIYGAGIGGGYNGNGGTITINGGMVSATGGGYGSPPAATNGGAGIGGGYQGSGGTITINNGIVYATSNAVNAAGIGGGNEGAGGDITINGGTVTATSKNLAAGIGGGASGAGGTITITGGTVTANSTSGVGIGGGGYGGDAGTFITGQNGSAFIIASSISDSDDKADWSGVIFEGDEGQVYGAPTLKTDVTISYRKKLEIPTGTTLTIDDNVTLTNRGTIDVSGMISGSLDNSGTITNQTNGTISGLLNNSGTITNQASGTISGPLNNSGTISNQTNATISGDVTNHDGGLITNGGTVNGSVTNSGTIANQTNATICDNVINNGTITTYGEISGSLTNSGTIMVGSGGSIPSGIGGSVIDLNNEKYLNAEGMQESIPDNTKVLLPGMTALSGWYVVYGKITLTERPTVTGEVHLILMDSCKLDTQAGITVEDDNSLTIYAQSNGSNMGKLTATGGDRQAGIGGGGAGGTITINGGTVIATGGDVAHDSSGTPYPPGAGIGGGGGGAGGNIIISGGTVTATGGSGEGWTAAGIGNGGDNNDASTFSTGKDGNAFITASSISDNDVTTDWSGVIFQGDEGKVYGTPALETDVTVPGGKTLEIPADTTLIIDSGVTLTNNGEITNNGTLTINKPGKLVNNGTLVNNSSITGNGAIEGGGKLTNNGTIANGIIVGSPTAPKITAQPQAKTVSVGETAEFTVTASGNPAPTCQWQVSKNNGGNWTDISGAANSSYTTEAASMSMNGWQYRCVVTNDKGTATSDPATLTVEKGVPPTAASQHLNIANHLAKTYTYLLSNLRPQLPEGASWENVTYELTSVSFTEAGYYTAGTAEIIHGLSQTLNTLSLPILFNDVTTEGKVGTVTVTIRSDNYQDFTNTLEIIASNKEAVTFSGVTGVTAPYTGQPVKGYTGELVIQDSNGGTVTPDLEISYTGRLETSYKGTQPPTEVGTYSVIFRVADTDPNYIGRLAVNFEITKAQGGGDPVNPGGGNGGGGTYTPPTYKPDVSKPSEGGGTPTVTPSNPKPGDTVTVKPRPDSGYEVDTITVTDKNGKPVEVTVKPDGTYTFKQPSGKVTIKVSYKPVDTPWNNPFADVSEGDWYYEAVRFVQERGLMNGIGNDNFAPNAQLSRAQLAQILFNKEGRPGVNYLLTFPDVASEAWYTEAIRWAASQGIVGSYGDGTFGPNDPITREQLAVMLWRYSGSPAATNKELHFNDEAEISGFALEALRWAVENGILNGYGDGRLGPQRQATRAQVAQMLKNFIGNRDDNI